MSLLYWLPLNRDARNQGTNEITITNSNVVFTGEGKVGASAVFNGTDTVLYGDISAIGNMFSICAWAKFNSLRSNIIFQIGKGSNYANTQVCVHTFANDAEHIYLVWNGQSKKITLPGDYTANWYHYCVTSDGANVSLYINGEKITEETDAETQVVGTRLAIGTYYGNSAADGYIQDVRVFNHTLSLREIREIAKAKMMHYSLSHDGFGGDNAFPNSSFSDNFTDWTTYGNGWEIVEEDGFKCAHIASSALKTTYYLQQDIINTVTPTYSSNQRYTISADVKIKDLVRGETNPMCQFYFGGRYLNNGTSTWMGATYVDSSPDIYGYSDTGWRRLSCSVTFAHEPTAMIASIYFRDCTGELYIRNMKFEVGGQASPWLPNSADTEYAELGLNSNIEYDLSGFGNNGVKTSVGYTGDSPRNFGSTVFDGSTSYILADSIDQSIKKIRDEITISIWVYRDTWTDYTGVNEQIDTFVSSQQGGGFVICYKDNGALYWICGTGDTSNTYRGADTGANYTQNIAPGWHMFTLVRDGYKTVGYLDGQFVAQSAVTSQKVKIYHHATAGLFLGAEAGTGAINPHATLKYRLTGKLADFRVYGTALSAEDVLELYNSPISVANNGTLLANNIVEA